MKKYGLRWFNLLLYCIATAFIIFSVILMVMDYLHQNNKSKSREYNAAEVIQDQQAVPAEPEYRVLFLSSYDPTFITAELERKGVEHVLYKANIVYDVQYMNTKKDRTEGNIEGIRITLEKRMEEGLTYDAVITADDAALHFAVDNHEQLFQGLPVFFMGVNDIDYAKEVSKNDFVTGVTEDQLSDEMIALALKQNPGAKNVVGIVDRTVTSQGDAKEFMKLQSKYKDLSFSCIYTTDKTRSALGSELEALDDSTILIYFNGQDDSQGNLYSMAENASFIRAHTSIPVYRPNIGGVGNGLTGGLYCDFYKNASDAAKMCVDAIKYHVDPKTIQMKSSGKGQCVFDQEMVDKYHINTHLLPKNTSYLNNGSGYWDNNRHIIFPMILLVAALCMFLINSIIATKRNAIYAKEAEDSHKELQKYYDDLNYEAQHDRMTGLLNRQAMVSRSKTKLSSMNDGDAYTIFAIDLDNMKEVNDSYGHDTGDDILRELAIRLQRIAIRYKGLISRYDGDEFVLLLPGNHSKEGDEVRETIENTFQDPVYIGDTCIIPTCSIGMKPGVISSESSVEEDVINADVALYHAKHDGKNTTVLFEPVMQEKMALCSRCRDALIEAFRHDGFTMLYQPKVSAKDHSLMSFEALARMKDNRFGPDLFVPLAEESGWIVRLGRVTTALVIKQLAEWKATGCKLYPVSINYSPGQLGDRDYVDYLRGLLNLYHLDPSLIQIEITESLFMKNADRALDLFSRLEAIGIKLLIDDFGSGYSNLEYLSYIPVDYIKIDKSLIDRGLAEDGQDTVIREIIRMSKDLDKITVAEGVETADQLQKLEALGCDEIQGYYFDRPLTSEDALELIQKPKYDK